MDTCILCGKFAGEAPARATIQTGWLAGSTIVGVARGATPNERFITSRLHYLEARDHPVAFCAHCWARNRALFTWFKWAVGVVLAGAAMIFLLLILQGNSITGWAFLGVVPLVVFLLVFLPVTKAISPFQRALKRVRSIRHQQEPASTHNWEPFKAHWPEKPYYITMTQRDQRSDTWT